MFILLSFFSFETYSQKNVQVKKTDEYSYEASCTINFPNDVSSKLMDYCWNIENISKMLANEPVKIIYTGNELMQFVSYDYKFLFFHYYSKYIREKSVTTGEIRFKLIKNNCNIPFIPNIISGYGEYTFTSNKSTTTMQYTQYSKCDGEVPGFYLEYIKNDIEKYFNKFEAEANKAIYNAKN